MPPWNETIYPVPACKKEDPLLLVLAGITHRDPTYRIRRQAGENLYVLEYVISGRGHIRYGEESFSPLAGDVYLIQPQVENEYYSDRNDPWEKMWFNLSGPLPEALVQAYSLQGVIHYPNCDLKGEFQEAMELVRRRGDLFYREFPLAIHRIFLGLHEWHIQHPRLEIDPRVVLVKDHLHNHWQEKISMKKLSSISGLSPAQLVRNFRKNYNLTPYNYLQKLRISYACQFLENTPYSVKTLAGILGYKDEFYFSNSFKQYMGLSPSCYRKSLRGEGKEKTKSFPLQEDPL